MSGPHAARAHGAQPQLPTPEAPPEPGTPPSAYDPRLGGALVFLIDIEAAREGGTLPQAGRPHAAAAHGARPPVFAPAGGLDTIRVSDLGWRGALPYPPLLVGGPDIERRVALGPAAADTYAWGLISLAAPGLVPGTALEGRDTALRRLRVRAGLQGWDPTRGLVTDPPAASLIDVFGGVGLTWRARDGGAEVPLRDPSAWLDAPIGNLTRYAQASRPDVVETALLQRAEALSLAAALGALWGVPRTLWQVTLPTASALLRDIGDVVTLRWPADGLRAGALGQVVGDSIRAGASEASLLILV